MVTKKSTIAKLASKQYIDIEFVSDVKRILICGNTENMFGQFTYDPVEDGCGIDDTNTAGESYNALQYIIDCIDNGVRIDIIGNNDTITYYSMLCSCLIDYGRLSANKCKKAVHMMPIKNDEEYLEFMSKLSKNNVQYDYIIQNPPYSKSLHLDFLTTGLDLLSKKGKMTIIEPATWLINVRKNGKASKYDEIKKMLDKHVYKVVIENYNKEFGTGLYVPFSVTYIDMDNEYNDIEFICCGDRKIVHNLYDCNMIGDYEMIHSILNKCQAYGDMMEDHVYKPGKSKTNDDTWYCKYCDIISVSGCYMSSPSCTTTNPYNANQMWKSHKNGDFLSAYIAGSIHHVENNLYNSLPFARKAGNYSTGEVKYSDKIANCIYGSKADLENWKHFVFNNKLPLFINICLTIDQNNTVKPYIPFIVDKQYTDEEIYNILNINKEEQNFIEQTLTKYERNSEWFKRYMCGCTK